MNCPTRMILLFIALCFANQSLAGKKGDGGGGDKGGGEAAPYTLVRLAPPGADVVISWGRDLDSSGNVVGYYVDAQGARNGFYYNTAAGTYDLFGRGIGLSGLNDLGQIVGNDQLLARGLFWTSLDDTQPTLLAPLAGDATSRAYKINDAGIVIGSSQGDDSFSAVAWIVHPDGTASAPILLPYPRSDVIGDLVNLNEADTQGTTQIIGNYGVIDPETGTANHYETAVGWQIAADGNGNPVLLSGPTDLELSGITYAAFGINDLGDVVGDADNTPVMKIAGGPELALPVLQKAITGVADAVNNFGQAVGTQQSLFKGSVIQTALFWPDPNTAVDLNKSVSLQQSERLHGAHAINDAGDILAFGFIPSITDRTVACLLVAARE